MKYIYEYCVLIVRFLKYVYPLLKVGNAKEIAFLNVCVWDSVK